MATIVIDPGHYTGYNTGVCPGYFEGNQMMKLAQYLGQDLTNMGATVRLTKTSADQNPTLSQRGQMATNADLFISLHTDANDDETARGVTSFYSVRQPETRPFATEIGQAVAGAMGNTFRGAVARESETTPGADYLGVIRAAQAAGARNAFLIEHGFHSNPEDCAVLSDDASLQRIATAEAAAIGRHFGLSAAPTPQTPSCRFNYQVQPGDSLYGIGHNFGIPWQDIAATNNISAPYSLAPGQNLTISGSGTAIYYRVQPGDSLYKIGTSYGVPWEDIAIANKLSSPYQLYIGQQLTIPQTCRVYYTVQAGDNLSSIGAKFGVPWQNIASVNGVNYPYTINIGDQLLVPLSFA